MKIAIRRFETITTLSDVGVPLSPKFRYAYLPPFPNVLIKSIYAWTCRLSKPITTCREIIFFVEIP